MQYVWRTFCKNMLSEHFEHPSSESFSCEIEEKKRGLKKTGLFRKHLWHWGGLEPDNFLWPPVRIKTSIDPCLHWGFRVYIGSSPCNQVALQSARPTGILTRNNRKLLAYAITGWNVSSYMNCVVFQVHNMRLANIYGPVAVWSWPYHNARVSKTAKLYGHVCLELSLLKIIWANL